MAIDTLGANALASDSVTTAKIVNDAVTAAKIPAGAVVADIADGGITTAKLADDAITGAKLANDIAISTTGNIATTGSGTITSAGAITASAGVAVGGTGAVNTLDDYEEGTFTPSITFGGGSTGIQYRSDGARRAGKYTKIGNVVEYYIHIEMEDKGSSTGGIEITGLPFTVTDNPSNTFWFPGAVFIQAMNNLTDGAPIWRAYQSNTRLDCYQISNSSYSQINNTHCTNTTGFQINGKYFINT